MRGRHPRAPSLPGLIALVACGGCTVGDAVLAGAEFACDPSHACQPGHRCVDGACVPAATGRPDAGDAGGGGADATDTVAVGADGGQPGDAATPADARDAGSPDRDVGPGGDAATDGGDAGAPGDADASQRDTGSTGACDDLALGAPLGQPVHRTPNAANEDRFVGTCAPEPGGRDVVFAFTPPAPAAYVFDTEGTDFDAVLYLMRSCQGTAAQEIACSPEDEGRFGIWAHLPALQTVFIVVDGARPDAVGEVVLNIRRLEGGGGEGRECVDIDLGSRSGPAVFIGDNDRAGDDLDVSCGDDDGGEDVMFTFAAPLPGTYELRLTDFERILFPGNY